MTRRLSIDHFGLIPIALGDLRSHDLLWILIGAEIFIGLCNSQMRRMYGWSTYWPHSRGNVGINIPYMEHFHQTFQVPKMEVLNLIRLFWRWGFPYINLTYRFYRWVPPFLVPEMFGDIWELFFLFEGLSCPCFLANLGSSVRTPIDSIRLPKKRT